MPAMTIPTNQLRYLRHARGLTQAGLAAAAGLGLRTVIRVEHGEVEPTLRTARAIARALGVSLDDVFTEAAA
jgi:DNA-binding XRE family transcriptional regulator